MRCLWENVHVLDNGDLWQKVRDHEVILDHKKQGWMLEIIHFLSFESAMCFSVLESNGVSCLRVYNAWMFVMSAFVCPKLARENENTVGTTIFVRFHYLEMHKIQSRVSLNSWALLSKVYGQQWKRKDSFTAVPVGDNSEYCKAGNFRGVKFSWIGDPQRFCGWTFQSCSTHITRLALPLTACTPQFQPAETFWNGTRVVYNPGYNLWLSRVEGNLVCKCRRRAILHERSGELSWSICCSSSKIHWSMAMPPANCVCGGRKNLHVGFYFAGLILAVCQSTAKIGPHENFLLYGAHSCLYSSSHEEEKCWLYILSQRNTDVGLLRKLNICFVPHRYILLSWIV